MCEITAKGIQEARKILIKEGYTPDKLLLPYIYFYELAMRIKWELDEESQGIPP